MLRLTVLDAFEFRVRVTAEDGLCLGELLFDVRSVSVHTEMLDSTPTCWRYRANLAVEPERVQIVAQDRAAAELLAAEDLEQLASRAWQLVRCTHAPTGG